MSNDTITNQEFWAHKQQLRTDLDRVVAECIELRQAVECLERLKVHQDYKKVDDILRHLDDARDLLGRFN